MNNILRLLAISLCTFYFALNTQLFAQAPQAIPYQAIARNASGNAIASTAVKVRFSIRDSIATGPVRYQETHTPTTSALGLFSVNVGAGTIVSGSFTGINWGKNAKFLQVELDPAGGNTYTNLGTTQMMSVPYALNAGNGVANGTANNQIMYWNGTAWTRLNPGSNGQTLTICNGVLTWTTGGVCPASLPTLSTTAASAITTTTATSGGSITNAGGGSISTRGVCWSTSQNPTIALTTKTSDGTGAGSFTSSLSGLSPNTLYYVRAYATNSAGTAYGNQVSFTTQAVVLPTLSTTAVSAISTTGATSGGTISSSGGATITAKGICWSINPNPTIVLATKTSNGTGTASFSSSMTNLAPNTTYYVRSYATNSAGTGYGNELTFSTPLIILATIVTNPVTSPESYYAISGGDISSNGGGSVSARGVCWSTSQNPGISLSTRTNDGSGTGTFLSGLGRLNPNTTYYMRAYATNEAGTAYGNQLSFTTGASSGLTVSDIDGNIYQTVTIGTQIWMKENLRVSKYRNGNTIPTNLNDTVWTNANYGAYSFPNNDPATNSIFGKLYNWYATVDARGLCPAGWHVPNDSDWDVLTNFLGGTGVAGGKLKATGIDDLGTGFWISPNTGATNETGFSALPSGYRPGYYDGVPVGYHMPIGPLGCFWSTTPDGSFYGMNRLFERSKISVDRFVYMRKTTGVAVRCLKD